MKRRFSTLALMIAMTGLSVYSQVNSKDEIVINKQMIEKFQKAEYTDNQVSFTDLFASYSFDEIKVIALAYQNNEIDFSSKEEISIYLARYQKENNDKQLELYSEKRSLASK